MSDPTARPDQRTGLLGWIIRHRWLTTFLCVALLLGLTVLLLDMAAKNRLRRQLDAIRAAGEPVTIEDLAALAPLIPDDENMYLALTACIDGNPAFDVPKEKRMTLPWLGQGTVPQTGQRLASEQLDTARWFLDASRVEATCLHNALKLARGAIPGRWKSPVMSFLLPELAPLRTASKFLALKAAITGEAGDSRTASEILLEMLHIEDCLSPPSGLIVGVNRTALRSLACDQIERTINMCGLDEPSLNRFQKILRAKESEVVFRSAVLTERVGFIDLMECVRAGTLSMDGVDGSNKPSRLRFIPAVLSLDEAEGLMVFRTIVDAVGEPDSKTLQRLKAAETQRTGLGWYSIGSRMEFSGHFSRVATSWVESVAANRTLQVAISWERFRLQHGEFPAESQALVPEYLEAIPLDPFDGKPLRHKLIDEGIVVYSIGEDGTDHGGDVGRLQPINPRSLKRPPDLGWIILRPELRGLPAESPEKPAD